MEELRDATYYEQLARVARLKAAASVDADVSLRLREAGMISSSPQKIIADGTDWSFVNEVKRELKA